MRTWPQKLKVHGHDMGLFLKKMLILFYLTLVSLYSPLSHSIEQAEISKIELIRDKKVEKRYKDSVKAFFADLEGKIPEKLIDQFAPLQREIETTSVDILKGAFMSGSGEAKRMSGVSVYNQVILNDYTLQYVLKSKYASELFVHEHLIAKGFDDKNYKIVIFLMLMRDLQEKKDIDFFELFELLELNLKPMAIDYLYADGGSGTSVGSGGDHISLQIKYETIKYFIQKNVDLSKVGQLMSIPFESDFRDINLRDVSIENIEDDFTDDLSQYRIILPGIRFRFTSSYIETTKDDILKETISLIEEKLK